MTELELLSFSLSLCPPSLPHTPPTRRPHAARLTPLSVTPTGLVSPAEWPAARRTCQLAREALLTAAAALKPGVTTDDIDAVVHSFAVEHEAYPSPLHYRCVCAQTGIIYLHTGRPPREQGAEIETEIATETATESREKRAERL
jgi:hypothetical protein